VTTTIAEAVDLIIDHRGRPTPMLSASGVQFVSAKNGFGGRLHLEVGQRFLSHELAAQWIRHEIHPGDVLLTSEAPLGEVAYFDGRAEICVGQRLFGLRARGDVLAWIHRAAGWVRWI
jgi:type I restriction enzyme S subunit